MVAIARSETWKNWQYEVDQAPNAPATVTPEAMFSKLSEVLERSAAGEDIDVAELDQLLGMASEVMRATSEQLQQAIDSLNELKQLQAENDQ